MSNSSIVKQLNEVTVFKNGDAYISQRKLADILNVKDSTLRMHISRDHPQASTDQGLSPKMVFLVTAYFAYESKVSTQESRDLLKQIGEAGAKAYLYHLAGFSITAQRESQKIDALLKLLVRDKPSEWQRRFPPSYYQPLFMI